MRALNRLGFKTRIFWSFIVLSIPLLLCVSLILYYFLYNGMEQKTMQTMQKSLNEAMIHLELIIKDTENLSRTILFNDDVQSVMQTLTKENGPVSLTSVSNVINSSIAYRDYIDSVVLTTPRDSFFSTESATSDIIRINNIRQKWWYEEALMSDLPFLWIPQARQSSLSTKVYNNNTMLFRKITSKQDFITPLGSMMIYLNNNYIDNFFNHIQIGQTANFWVIDEQKTVIFSKKSSSSYDNILKETLDEIYTSSYNQSSKIKSIGGHQYLICWSRFPNKDWSILGVVPFLEINQSFIIMKQQIIVMMALFIFIAMPLSFMISSSISKPIKYLAKTMDKYGDEPDNSSTVKSLLSNLKRQDEIGTIYKSYIQLINRIENLIKEIYLKDMEKKDAEMAALESQIHPHFLYNTLDSINWLAMAGGQNKISEMVTALSDTFRLSLRKTDSPYIRFSDEIQHVQSYLVIQQYRYGERLKCNYSIDPATLELYTLRFILQPLVENALEHGINKIEGNAVIDIKASLEGGKLVISIINDGKGINLDKINQILSSNGIQPFEPKDNDTCYGIKNINNRIHIVHGSDYGLEYLILENSKTLCRVALPILTADRHIVDNIQEVH